MICVRSQMAFNLTIYGSILISSGLWVNEQVLFCEVGPGLRQNERNAFVCVLSICSPEVSSYLFCLKRLYLNHFVRVRRIWPHQVYTSVRCVRLDSAWPTTWSESRLSRRKYQQHFMLVHGSCWLWMCDLTSDRPGMVIFYWCEMCTCL